MKLAWEMTVAGHLPRILYRIQLGRQIDGPNDRFQHIFRSVALEL
jgi:hypothetical protein